MNPRDFVIGSVLWSASGKGGGGRPFVIVLFIGLLAIVQASGYLLEHGLLVVEEGLPSIGFKPSSGLLGEGVPPLPQVLESCYSKLSLWGPGRQSPRPRAILILFNL